jgi:hypothetical protein
MRIVSSVDERSEQRVNKKKPNHEVHEEHEGWEEKKERQREQSSAQRMKMGSASDRRVVK